MNRVFKFRVWDIKGEKFQECYDIGMNGEFAHVAISDHCYLINEEGKEPEFVLQQFTGLFDKNGREIYEGDIVKGSVWFPDENGNKGKIFKSRGVIEFKYGAFCIVKDDKYQDWLVSFFKGDEDQAISPSEIEVIGNVFENKDLLS